MDEQVHRLKRDFTYLSPGPTEAKRPFDFTSLMLSFGHPEAMNHDFLEKLKAIHARAKLGFLNQGRMFNSAIPMLVVRRMHRSDLPLLNKPEEIAAYRKIYAS